MTEERRKLWHKVFHLTFRAWYAELLLAAWLGTWRIADGFVAIGTAVTASGSAIAGWSLWSEPGWRETWVALAGAAALASIAHTKLGIGNRIDRLQASWSEFLDVRSDAKTLLDRMDLGLATSKASEIFFDLERKYQHAEQKLKAPLLEPSERRRTSIRARVEKELADYAKGAKKHETYGT